MYRNIEMCVCTIRFLHIHQDPAIHVQWRSVGTLRFLHKLRFVHFGQKGKHDHWIDYHVFKQRPINAGKHDKFIAAEWRSHLLLGLPSREPWHKKCLVKSQLVEVTPAMSSSEIFKIPLLAHSQLLMLIRFHALAKKWKFREMGLIVDGFPLDKNSDRSQLQLKVPFIAVMFIQILL